MKKILLSLFLALSLSLLHQSSSLHAYSPDFEGERRFSYRIRKRLDEVSDGLRDFLLALKFKIERNHEALKRRYLNSLKISHEDILEEILYGDCEVRK